tara:strand:- start:208 stop:1068 length:861 start_codon:yes stop_codon:yes gene_type:complete
MIKSMTGFGVATIEKPSENINLEIKSLNSRNLDIRFSGLNINAEFEQKIKKIISNVIERGSVKVSIELDKNNVEKTIKFDENKLNSIILLINEIESKFKKKLDINSLISLNDIYSSSNTQISDDKETIDAFIKALSQLDKARIDEGKEIHKDFQKRLKRIKIDIISIEKLAKKLTLRRKSEIAEKIKFLTEQDSLDENRLMQEVAYLIERSDITEETVRVNIHIGSFLKYLESNDPVGKRLGFLAQEISREINTIGSKSPLPKITSKIVEIKNELEKIKEQLQNIL